MSDYIYTCLDESMKKRQIINTVLMPVFVALIGHDVNKIQKASGDHATEAYDRAVKRSKLFANLKVPT